MRIVPCIKYLTLFLLLWPLSGYTRWCGSFDRPEKKVFVDKGLIPHITIRLNVKTPVVFELFRLIETRSKLTEVLKQVQSLISENDIQQVILKADLDKYDMILLVSPSPYVVYNFRIIHREIRFIETSRNQTYYVAHYRRKLLPLKTRIKKSNRTGDAFVYLVKKGKQNYFLVRHGPCGFSWYKHMFLD